MFGKKKSNASEEAAPKAAAPAKTKTKNVKAKSGSSSGGAKEFFLRHTEKIILGVVSLAAVFLIYEGTKTKNLSTGQSPDSLTTKAKATLDDISKDHWEAIAKEPERKVEDGKYMALSQKAIQATDPKPYAIGAWAPGADKAGEKRGDPKLLAPLALEGRSVYGPMNSLVKTKPQETIELEKLKDAPPIGKRKKADADSKPDPRDFSTKYDRGYDGNNNSAGAMGSGGNDGLMGGGGMGGFKRNAGSSDEDTAKVKVAKSVLFNSVVALLPHERQWEEFDLALKESSNYDVTRDSPKYLGFEVERVDVTDNPSREIAEDEWKALESASSKSITEASKTWGGQCIESVQSLYLDENLSMPIPPVFMRDYRKFSMHSYTAGAKETPVEFKSRKEKADEKEKKSKASNQAAGGGGLSGGGPGGDVMDRSGPGGMGGMGGMGGLGGGAPGKGGGALGGSTEYPTTEYKLIRFYDFDVTPGRVYRYRVRYMIDDPNYPKNSSEPLLNSMQKTVQERVLGLKEADRKREQETKGKGFERSTTRRGPWSNPTYPIRVSHPGLLVSGGQARDYSLTEATVGDAVVKFEDSPTQTPGPRIYWGFASWDSKHSADVVRTPINGVTDVAELGKVLVGKTDSKKPAPSTLNPVTKRISANPDYVFSEAVTVLDMRASQDLAVNNRNKDPLQTSAEILTMDGATGELRVSMEIADYEAFRLYTFADEVDALKTSNTGSDANKDNAGGPPGGNGSGRGSPPGGSGAGKGGAAGGGGKKFGGGGAGVGPGGGPPN